MNKYKYQMHAHTSPASACGAMLPHELVNELYAGGYSGCVLTNHFIGGNTGVDRKLPWEQLVERFSYDYYAAKREAEKYDIDIIFGVEQGVGGGLEILCYGVTPELLTAHPELRKGSCEVWYNVLHANGGLCLQAHPFRQRDYIPKPDVLPLEFIDGIEVYNAANSEEDNERAESFALEHPELILVSGADTHSVSTVCMAGIETDRRIRNEKEVADVLISGGYTLIK